ncbi:MAG: glycosyltransferase [Syntrophales bacterium]|nr:glycosyltransferase [Syntrophales bacterium]
MSLYYKEPKPHSPRVSIGMPVYNGARYIRGAIDSIIDQTFTDFELIISDNSSTDETEQICRYYESIDPRITYIRQAENRGPIWNFNYVLNSARAEYFMWAAADDRRESRFLDLAVEILDRDCKTGIVFSEIMVLNLDTGIYKDWRSCGYSVAKNKFSRYVFRLINSCPSIIYGLCRKNILSRLELREFDYFDLYVTHWFELESSIKIIPLPLFIAGEKGDRVPYSLTKSKINYQEFIRAEYALLKRHFGFPTRIILISTVWFLVHKYTAQFNRTLVNNKET